MAAAAAAPSSTLTMKLLVDHSSPLRPRVVFAEASKETVDFLFSLLAMPAGTAVNLLGKESMAGCMGNLYGSAERLDDAYVQPGAATNKQDVILCAAMQSPAAAGPNSWLFRLPEPKRTFFNCSYTGYSSCRNYVTEVRGTRCPQCNNQMVTEAKPVGSPEPGARRGFVQGGTVTYTVTDDLLIWPMSNVSSVALLNTAAVRDLGSLKENTVQIGYKEGVEILRASLQSRTVLTDVFLGKLPPPPQPQLSRSPSTNNNSGGASSTARSWSWSNGGKRPESLSWRA